MRAYLAVGHGLTPEGREDPGAVGGGWTEQTAGDRIVAAAADRLRAAGVEVRHEAYQRDPNFYGSTTEANDWGADVVVAVHHDIRTAPEGSFAYHWPSSARGRELAQEIVDHVEADGLPTRPAWLGPGEGFAAGPVAGRGLYILEHTRAPACLLEVGPIGHATLDDDAELGHRGDLLADAVLAFGSIAPPGKAPAIIRDVALAAKREPDRGWIRMVAHAHRFAYVEQGADGWTQIYPDGRTTHVDDIDHLVAFGWDADQLLAANGGRGVAITPGSANLTRLRTIEMIRQRDVGRRRPWSA